LDIIRWWQVRFYSSPITKPQRPTSFDFAFQDADGDGVPNNIDDCPETPGLAINKGCPVHEDISWVSASNNIAFESGKSSLLQESYVFLDKIVSVLEQQPSLKLSIQGHTDDVGTDMSNQKLSEERAQTCLEYLLSKGIAANRLSHIGFDETQPIAENNNEFGRSQNRRVTFIQVKGE
jgi:OmpA-OmpF porin, OOP family